MYGFVYLWYHAENEEPNWLPDSVPEVESHSWKYRGRSEFRVACHIQVCTMFTQYNVQDSEFLSKNVVCGHRKAHVKLSL